MKKGKVMQLTKNMRAFLGRRWLRTSLGSAVALGTLAACQPMYNLELRGEWRIHNIYSTPASNLSSEQTLRWRQYQLNFTERTIGFADKECLSPHISSDWQQLGVVANRIGVGTEVFGLH